MFRAYLVLLGCIAGFGYLLRDSGWAGETAAIALALWVYGWAGDRWEKD